MFRPAAIQPMHGVRSKTGWVQAIYTATAPLLPLLKAMAPGFVTDTAQMGRAMLRVARERPAQRIFENGDINRL
jgi:hypothetical protein